MYGWLCMVCVRAALPAHELGRGLGTEGTAPRTHRSVRFWNPVHPHLHPHLCTPRPNWMNTPEEATTHLDISNPQSTAVAAESGGCPDRRGISVATRRFD